VSNLVLLICPVDLSPQQVEGETSSVVSAGFF
jgi:hypothetical protein